MGSALFVRAETNRDTEKKIRTMKLARVPPTSPGVPVHKNDPSIEQAHAISAGITAPRHIALFELAISIRHSP
jgi:hypothetical protein